MRKLNLPKVMFGFSLAALVFGLGMLVGHTKVFPYSQIKYAIKSAILVFDEAGMITQTKPDHHLFTSRYDGSDVVQADLKKMAPGLTLITGFWEDGLQIRLLGADGAVVNRWPVSYRTIWEGHDGFIPKADRPKTDWNRIFNGIVALQDGSIIFPLGGLVKLDRCGNVLWRVEHMVHHSIERSPTGSFWVPGTLDITTQSKHPPLKTPYKEHTVVEISEDGKIIQEISILDVLWKNDMLPTLFANNRSFDSNPEMDVVHLNDVEEIPVDFLGSFPQFAAGDLLVSLRESNMIMVLDPVSYKVKWYQIGPWIQQHDADWQSDGTIVVFDNNHDTTEDGSILGGSKIISINPSSGVVKYLYGDEDGQDFYTAVQGDQQVLSNGNILIIESNAGRIIEIAPSGDVVWEYINRYSENEVIRIPDAVRYPPDYFEVQDWSCN